MDQIIKLDKSIKIDGFKRYSTTHYWITVDQSISGLKFYSFFKKEEFQVSEQDKYLVKYMPNITVAYNHTDKITVQNSIHMNPNEGIYKYVEELERYLLAYYLAKSVIEEFEKLIEMNEL
jgi:hypothetical protein